MAHPTRVRTAKLLPNCRLNNAFGMNGMAGMQRVVALQKTTTKLRQMSTKIPSEARLSGNGSCKSVKKRSLDLSRMAEHVLPAPTAGGVSAATRLVGWSEGGQP